MSAAEETPITFVVPGRKTTAGVSRGGGASAPLPAGLTEGRMTQSVHVSTQREDAREARSHGEPGGADVTAVPGEDVVVLQIAGGPDLVLSPRNARDLMLAQSTATRSRGADAGRVPVPSRLQWRGLEQGGQSRGVPRGTLGDVKLSAVHIVSGLLKGSAAEWTAAALVERFEGTLDAGVFQLTADALPKSGGKKVEHVAASSEPMLVFIHGTFSTTHGTFGKLWTNHPERVRVLFEAKHYGDRVYGLDHATLGESPIANALMLVKALPKGARLHLVTHSRGGLVAEVVAHVCARAGGDLAAFAGKDYAGQRAELEQLATLAATKNIQVERVVRVACPARGTLLASNRLDAYVSVFKWTLSLANIPVAPALVDFLGGVAQCRTDPRQIPGLAAQMPDSPLVKWLHSVDKRIDGQLRVIAGDIEGDSVTSWLKTLLADAFYWTDNDLVVQTRSMYGGGPRSLDACFLLDAGGGVSHFNYFTNDRTVEAVVNALLDAQPRGFRTIGPLSWAGTSATGDRAARPTVRQQREKPAVFLLPGILGSNLKVGDDRVWVGWRLINGLGKLAYPGAKKVAADGPIERVYDDLITYLSTTHEVIPFGFDWRLPLEDEARRLAELVEQALDAREKGAKPIMPVRIIAHSMGGLLARTMHLVRPDVWTRMMAHADARLLMLGTPNGGSWAPMQVLSGDDTFGNTLVAAGAPFHGHDARMEMAMFPGFIQLQAGLLDQTRRLDTAARWQQLADDDLRSVEDRSWWHQLDIQRRAVEWGVPSQDVLDRAVELRKLLDKQRDGSLATFADKLLLVTGHARFTPAGYEESPDGLVYLNAPDEGDGRVTSDSALLPGVRTWTLNCEHGALPSKKEAFAAYGQLLNDGKTELLDPLVATASRGAAELTVRVRARPSRSAVSTRPVQDEQEVLSVSRREPSVDGPTSPGTALRITVVNGDLTFIHHPLLLGHYRSSRLTGTERVMDERVGEMNRSLKAGLYPDAPGSHEIFVNKTANRHNPLQLPRPQAVIVVGLGPEGNLQPADLVTTVRQGVIAWAHRLAETEADLPPFFEMATTLIGSGGSGITARQSAQLIAQGVREANERLDEGSQGSDGDPAKVLADAAAGTRPAKPQGRKWPQVGHLHIIELYLERATEALSALQMQAIASPGRFTVTDVVGGGIGALRRSIDAGYRGADYDFVTAVAADDAFGNSVIQYTLDTKRARSEVRAQSTQRKLLLNLVTGASNALNTDPQIGRTLFQLLVPIEMEAYLSGTTDLQMALDSGTAGIPWELLDTDTQGRRESRPWAIRVKLLRKLLLKDFRARVVDADADSSVLVIGEPKCDPDKYPRLSGARAEARAVADRLMSADALGGDRVRALISSEDPDKCGPDAREVSNALMERDWRIVHISGHGEPPEMIGKEPLEAGDPPQREGNPRGVVLSDGSFLGPREIQSVRRVPELVFVNCCHLAWRPGQDLLKKNHVRFAAGVAEALIGIGVRCVIAAGWAVDDAAARLFATTFYGALLRGCRFIDAVAEAREAAWAVGGNTWAAYQCYGDPDWRFKREGSDAQRVTPPADEFLGVTSATALIIALETAAVESEFQKADAQRQRDKIRYLSDHFAARWGHIGKVAEAFGKACAEARDPAGAIAWYTRAVEANDGSAGMKAAEQRGNWRARLAWEAVDHAGQAVGSAKGPKKQTAQRALTAAIARERPTIVSAIADLEQLALVQPSMERESLCGSAYKRLALLEAAAKRPRAEESATRKMMEHYALAEALGRKHHLDFFYPAMNRMAAELAQYGGTAKWKGFKRAQFEDLRQALQTKAQEDPEFWSVGGVIELRVYEALQHRDLAGELDDIAAEFKKLRERVEAAPKWQSIYDNARFVLPKYASRVPPAEKAAANALLKTLARWAEGGAA